jgi:hypothetical protein
MHPLSKYFLLLSSLLLLQIKANSQKPDFAFSIQCPKYELPEEKNSSINEGCKYGYLLSYGQNTIGTIDLPNLSCVDGADVFNIIFEKTIGNQSYIIIEYRHKSRGCHWKERGSCGAGEEFGLIWVSINKTTCSIIESKSFLYVSCTYNKYCRTDQPINLMFENNKIDFIILRCMDKLRFFNKKRPELGFF